MKAGNLDIETFRMWCFSRMHAGEKCLNTMFLLLLYLKSVKVGRNMKGSIEIEPVSREETWSVKWV